MSKRKTTSGFWPCFCLCLGLLTIGCTSARPVGSSASREKINDGYSSTKKKDVTSAASVMSDFDASQDLTSRLQQIPGVTVSGSGANARVTVRGNSGASDFMNTDPLFVLDGSPIQGNYSRVYQQVNVNDIKRITVLKDNSAASIYGSRGINGVIVIEYKK